MPYIVDPVIPAGTIATALQPSIEIDEDLTARPFGLDDAAGVMAAFSDPDIQRWHGFRVDDLDEAGFWINRSHELWASETSAVWAIVDAEDQLLGRCALYFDLRRGVAEIAYWVLPAARRRGVAVRAAVAVTQWAHALGVHRVLLQHSTQNPASCSVAGRAGFTAEGTGRQQDLHADGWHDMHQHSHLADD